MSFLFLLALQLLAHLQTLRTKQLEEVGNALTGLVLSHGRNEFTIQFDLLGLF